MRSSSKLFLSRFSGLAIGMVAALGALSMVPFIKRTQAPDKVHRSQYSVPMHF